MIIGSMCTGYGGLDHAVMTVFGGTLAWTADPDPAVSVLLKYHYPNVPNWGDIKTVDWTSVPAVDVLTAGFPCQPVSSAGLRAGIDDERWLWDDIASAIGNMESPPSVLVLENVSGLLTANGGRAMARVVHGLATLGYMGSWRTVRASDVGAPHRRERIFIVAWTADSDTHRLRQRCRQIPYAVPPSGAPDKAKPLGDRMARSHDQWGPYASAIARWERVTGQTAPPPVEPGRRGQPRLSTRFVEWLMGLPPGWVTAVPGLSRSAQLRLLGNGVVPLQAAYAIHMVLNETPSLTCFAPRSST